MPSPATTASETLGFHCDLPREKLLLRDRALIAVFLVTLAAALTAARIGEREPRGELERNELGRGEDERFSLL